MDEFLTRFFEDIVGRLHGPMNARLPASQDHQQHLEDRGVDHEREVISQQKCCAVPNRSIESWDRAGVGTRAGSRPAPEGVGGRGTVWQGPTAVSRWPERHLEVKNRDLDPPQGTVRAQAMRLTCHWYQ